MAQHGQSAACCSVPPAKADYKEKGSMIEVAGMNIYKTGSPSATSAIIIIYDIFGFSPQTYQGADVLAYSGDDNHKYQVFIPDLFFGKPIDQAQYPPDTPEKGAAVGAFFQGPGNPGSNARKIPSIVKQLTEKTGGVITKWGAVGMCWGGKVVSLTSGPGTVFTAVSEVHPAMVDPADAEKITVPIALLASGDEDAQAVKKFGEALHVENYIETFGDQVHGWMATRGDLTQPRVSQEYERGYKTLLEFFHKYL